MKVLVTGSSGMVGKHLVAYLSSHGHKTVGTDIVGDVNRGSVTDKSFVFGVLAKLDFEAIVHLAGVTDIKKTIEDPHSCYEVNCFGTLNMLELGVKKGVRRFLYACYDEQTRVFTTEGVKRYYELSIGDCVLTINPSSGVIETKPIKQIYV